MLDTTKREAQIYNMRVIEEKCVTHGGLAG
jgi:hypothetical protein